ncbi:unnamed protein product [Fraxinus pennsylvanica]|uniref:Wound-induced protein 1 n=1 Tax=Fraxinus pennsylvanica TaxID=56036 RepID=A0AAD2DPK6_9LAMI|nr:unnamed protein product [Fraxinus pennsylvanica]
MIERRSLSQSDMGLSKKIIVLIDSNSMRKQVTISESLWLATFTASFGKPCQFIWELIHSSLIVLNLSVWGLCLGNVEWDFSSLSVDHVVLKLMELANPQETLEDTQNEGVVITLYDALKKRDAEAVQKILAPDLEWWFHGPPSHQFLMRLLTGAVEEDTDTSFIFLPHSISAFGSTVLVEGFDQTRSISWVHAWTVTDGIITQVREYFNTSLTVTRFGKTDPLDYSNITSLHCPSLWESSLPNRVGKSVPGLVLAI